MLFRKYIISHFYTGNGITFCVSPNFLIGKFQWCSIIISYCVNAPSVSHAVRYPYNSVLEGVWGWERQTLSLVTRFSFLSRGFSIQEYLMARLPCLNHKVCMCRCSMYFFAVLSLSLFLFVSSSWLPCPPGCRVLVTAQGWLLVVSWGIMWGNVFVCLWTEKVGVRRTGRPDSVCVYCSRCSVCLCVRACVRELRILIAKW